MNKPKDLVLSGIARRFITSEPWPMPAFFNYEMAFDGLDGYKNLLLSVCKRFMQARFHFGGRQRIVIVVPIQRASEAARFGDLIVLKLWKYRQRASIPSDCDTNFSLERAKEDYAFLAEHRPDIIRTIDEIEKHFLALEIFRVQDPNVPEPKKEKRASIGDKVIGSVNLQFEMLEQMMTGMGAGLNELRTAAKANVDLHAGTAARLDAIESTLALSNTRLAIVEALFYKMVHLLGIQADRLDAVKEAVTYPHGLPTSSQPIEQKPPVILDGQTELPVAPFKTGVGFAEIPGNKAGIIDIKRVGDAIAERASVFSVGNKKQSEA